MIGSFSATAGTVAPHVNAHPAHARLPLLEIRDLEVQFGMEDGVVRAVDGVTYTIEAEKTPGRDASSRLVPTGYPGGRSSNPVRK